MFQEKVPCPSPWSKFDTEEERSRVLRNVGISLPKYTVSQPVFIILTALSTSNLI
jgi:hypothetical protein